MDKHIRNYELNSGLDMNLFVKLFKEYCKENYKLGYHEFLEKYTKGPCSHDIYKELKGLKIHILNFVYDIIEKEKPGFYTSAFIHANIEILIHYYLSDIGKLLDWITRIEMSC